MDNRRSNTLRGLVCPGAQSSTQDQDGDRNRWTHRNPFVQGSGSVVSVDIFILLLTSFYLTLEDFESSVYLQDLLNNVIPNDPGARSLRLVLQTPSRGPTPSTTGNQMTGGNSSEPPTRNYEEGQDGKSLSFISSRGPATRDSAPTLMFYLIQRRKARIVTVTPSSTHSLTATVCSGCPLHDSVLTSHETHPPSVPKSLLPQPHSDIPLGNPEPTGIGRSTHTPLKTPLPPQPTNLAPGVS